ncbi:hypothetical protein EON65_54605 [archaeon]|nr:MAG: hypothetical protein EON65_54605 [archaeon]
MRRFTVLSGYYSSLRQQWEKDQDNQLLRFQYASVLCRSAQEQDRLEALLHLETLVMDKDSSAYMRDALYLMSVLRYVMGDYDAARSCAEELCRIDPDNPQVGKLVCMYVCMYVCLYVSV